MTLQMKSVQRHQTSATLHRQVITYMEELNEAGGIYAVMNELAQAGLLNTRPASQQQERRSEKISRNVIN